MAKSGSFKIPTRESEDKLAREEEAKHQRIEENGQSIITMWMVGYIIVHNSKDFQLPKDCKVIIGVSFSGFTNQSGSSIDLTEDDMQFLNDFAEEFKREYLHNNVEVHEGFNCRDLWKAFLQAFWTSSRFKQFETKFAAKLVLPSIKRDDGSMLSISDNLFLLDKLTKFFKIIELRPTLSQMMSSFYALSGLSVVEKAELMWSRKKDDDLMHQLKIETGKTKRTTDALKDATEKADFLQKLLEREQAQSKDLLEQIASLQSELAAHKIALSKYRDANPAECVICQTLYTSKTSMKITSCCGTIICDSCYEDLKRHTQRDNPNCPQCRCKTRQDATLVRILESHPTIRRLEVCDSETITDQEVFLEAAIGGPELKPIPNPKPSRPPSIYAQLLEDQLSKSQACAGGGGAARRGPPAARADA
jgi:hypothetical protein